MTYDAIILGTGAMGSAAAFELARRGQRVLALEQFALGHDRGSSHGSTRVIRKAYFEHPDYVPLVRRAYERWYELEQLSGQHLLTETGCLNIGQPGGEIVNGIRQASAQHGIPLEELDARALRGRFPAFHFDESYLGLLEKEAGFLYVERCVLAHAEEARKRGADIHENEAALSREASGSGVSARTQHKTYAAAKLIVTAGAWSGHILARLGLPLTVLRKTLFWLSPAEPAQFRRDVFPIYLSETPAGFYYGFPMIDPLGCKLARHDAGDEVADPARVERRVTEADEADCRAYARRHLPQADGPRRHAKVCLYTVTPDRHFIMDLHPEHPQVVLAAGFSGHGFKFATVVGEILADLAEK